MALLPPTLVSGTPMVCAALAEREKPALVLYAEGASAASQKKVVCKCDFYGVRAVGLGYVFGFTSDICNSLGESTLASLVTAVGRVEIFLLALPYFVKTVELGVELLT